VVVNVVVGVDDGVVGVGMVIVMVD